MQSHPRMGSARARPRDHPRTKAGDGLTIYRRWLALDDTRLRLLDDLCELQQGLERRAGWFALSDSQRREIEQQSGYSRLNSLLDSTHRRLRRRLRGAAVSEADSLAAVTASLCVAERLLPIEENRVVHRLIKRAVRDLIRLDGRQDFAE